MISVQQIGSASGVAEVPESFQGVRATPVLSPSLAPSLRPAVAPPALPGAVASPNEEAYRRALAAYEAAFERFDTSRAKPYWDDVTAARASRRNIPLSELGTGRYVTTPPPVYDGPPKPKRSDFGLGPEPTRPRAVVADFVRAAHARGYRFDLLPADATPKQAAAFETQFRRNYVKAAKAAGFTREQVLGVYVFETGGNGVHTELATTSSAIGYAQLLIANSITTTVEQGRGIAERLRAQGLTAKADLVLRLRREIIAANHGREPTWGEAQGMSSSQLGQAVHAANLDRDIGPQLQITKLMETARLYRVYAGRKGSPNRELTPELLEAMNLAGPMNGFALSHPALADRLTVNFFERGGYEGNPIAGETGPDGVRRARTAGSLMTRMSEIMHGPRTSGDGYREIAAIFDELSRPTAVRRKR